MKLTMKLFDNEIDINFKKYLIP